MQTTDHAHSPVAAPAHYTPPLWATEDNDRALSRIVGPTPLPPFDLPAPRAPLVTIEQDPAFHWINRATLGVVILFVLYMALQFAGAWIGGKL